MSSLKYTTDLKTDVLFRGGEPTDGSSDYDSQVLDYINRAQVTLAMGGLEFNEDIQVDWWWLRKQPPGVLTLQPPFEDGTADVTYNSETLLLSSPPAFSLEGYFFRADETNDVFRVITHTGGSNAVTLDSAYTGDSDSAAGFIMMKLEYELATDLLRVTGPMRGYTQSPFEVDGIEVGALDRDFPLAMASEGVPVKFAHVDEQKVRFSHYGVTDKLYRIEYDYLMLPTELTATTNEEPIVPIQYRRILADMALTWLYAVKDDNRAPATAGAVKMGIRAMANEDSHRKTAYSRTFGKIQPRQDKIGKNNQSLQTDSGFIIR